MKTIKIIYGIILFSLLLSLVGCNTKNTEQINSNPTSVSILSKTNLDNWEIASKLIYNGSQKVIVNFEYKGSDAKMVSASIGNGTLKLKEIKKGENFELGSSIGDNTERLTFNLSWYEKGKLQKGNADFMLK